MRTKTMAGLMACMMTALLLSGCAMLHDKPQTSKLRIRGFFDGADALHVQGNSLWIQHYAYQLPGRWHGLNEPMYVNGEKWYPEWMGNKSNVYRAGTNALPAGPVEVRMEFSATSWGDVKLYQQPSEENDYTLIVTIDDRGPTGGHWYTVDLDW